MRFTATIAGCVHGKWKLEYPGGGYSVRFWIGMLSTARRLETLQGSKKGGRNYTFCPILMKNRGRNTTFSSFLLKYRGRNYTNFPETWKRGSKWRSICSNLHIVSAPPPPSTLRLILISSTWDCITFHSFNVKVEKKSSKVGRSVIGWRNG